MWSHRVVGSLVAVWILLLFIFTKPEMALVAIGSSGMPVALLAAFDRAFYGPPQTRRRRRTDQQDPAIKKGQ